MKVALLMIGIGIGLAMPYIVKYVKKVFTSKS